VGQISVKIPGQLSVKINSSLGLLLLVPDICSPVAQHRLRAVFDLTKLLHLQNQALLDEVDLGSKRSLADPTKVNFGAAICRRSGTGTPLRFYLPVYATLPPPLAMFELNCRADHACVTSAWSGLL